MELENNLTGTPLDDDTLLSYYDNFESMKSQWQQLDPEAYEIFRREVLAKIIQQRIMDGSYLLFARAILGFGLPAHQKVWFELSRQKRVVVLAPRDHGKCERASSLKTVFRGNKSLVLMCSEVQVGDLIWGWDQKYNLPVKTRVLAVEDNGIKPLYRIETCHGRLAYVTGNHPFLIRYNWKEAKDLLVGDYIGVVVASHPRTSEVERYLISHKKSNFLEWDIVSKIEILEGEPTTAIQTEHETIIIDDIITHNTQVYSNLVPLYDIAHNENIRILLIGKTLDNAKKNLRVIKQELETNDAFKRFFGDRYTSDNYWTEKHIYCKRSKNLKDPTIEAVGSLGSITGGRADLIILDDLVDDIAVLSEIQRNKLLDWFRGTVIELLEPDGRCLVVGTRKHYKDLYSHLIDNDPTFRVHLDKSIDVDNLDKVKYDPKYEIHNGKKVLVDIKVKTKDINVLWPEKWPLVELLKKRVSIGSVLFSRENQNEIIDEDTTPFKIQYLEQCRNPELSYIGADIDGQLPYEALEGYFRFIIQAWDLSSVDSKERAQSRDTDYTVGVTLGVARDGVRYLLSFIRDRGLSYETIKSMIKQQYARFNPLLVVCEANLFQNIYVQTLLAETYMPLIGHVTTKSKADINTGIPRMASNFERKEYSFPYKLDSDKRITDLIFTEFHDLGRGLHDDCVMSLWLAECGIPRCERYCDQQEQREKEFEIY